MFQSEWMKPRPNYLSLPERNAYRTLEDVLGCKWSSAVIAAVSRGIQRPGALERAIPGISTKVLNERLRRLIAFRLLERTEYPGRPARVDYHLTPMGVRVAELLGQLRELNALHTPAAGTGAGSADADAITTRAPSACAPAASAARRN